MENKERGGEYISISAHYDGSHHIVMYSTRLDHLSHRIIPNHLGTIPDWDAGRQIPLLDALDEAIKRLREEGLTEVRLSP